MDPTCSQTARALAEPLHGTAPVARGWLLVEQPGAWGRDALHGSRLDTATAQHLAAGAEGTGVRVQIIRRPSAPGSAPTARAGDGGPRTVVLAHTGPTPWMEVVTLPDRSGIADIDPALCARAEPPGLGETLTTPLALVCTHASRDRCCATLGRPIAATLHALHGDAIWEVSHIGGHRFAGTLVVLPSGAVYGGVDVTSAVEIVAAHQGERLVLDRLRGRSGLPRAAQAAEILARRELGLDHLGAVTDVAVLEEPADDADGAVAPTTVTLRAGGRRVLVQVTRVATGTARRLSCDADVDEDPGTFVLTGLHEG